LCYDSGPVLFAGGGVKRLAILLVFFLQVFVFSHAIGQGVTKIAGLKISSPALENGREIPKKFTCDGANVNPPLKIENVPSNAKSLALILDDIDAPRGTYVHWILWNIAPDI
jgi:phosphatidylethanolamine-binding protein (PEBP) family uncharacterized protein